MRVGFIGLGTMGAHAARNILRKGFPLVVHDIRDEAARPLIDMGAEWGTDPADVLARVDVVVTMVFGPKEIEQVARGGNGLFSAPCEGKTWIDLTTSSPSLMRALGREFAERGGYPIDAPVTGAVDGAIQGDMLMFVGGNDEAVERVRVVIEAMGEIRHVGKHGNAYVAKLVNNMLWKVHAAAIGEAMVAAKVAGLEPEVWWEAMKGGAADSYVMHHDVPAVFARHYDPSFPIALCLKDLDLIDELMRETGVRNDLIDATHARFREAGERYGLDAGERYGLDAGERYGLDAGDMTVCKLLEDDAGVELRVPGDWVASWEVRHPDDES